MTVIGRTSNNAGTRVHRRPRTQRPGLTLLECTIALIIVPMCVTALALAITAGQRQAAEALRQMRAAMLAESLMEEVIAVDRRTEETEDTRGWTQLSDCDGYAEAAGDVKYPSGDDLISYPDDLQSFSREVTCDEGETYSLDFGGETHEIEGVRITVTVRQDGAKVVAMERFFPDS